MPEWLDRALIGVLVALAASFFWGCIAGIMGAFSILIWIAGIAAIVGIVSRARKQTIQAATALETRRFSGAFSPA